MSVRRGNDTEISAGLLHRYRSPDRNVLSPIQFRSGNDTSVTIEFMFIITLPVIFTRLGKSGLLIALDTSKLPNRIITCKCDDTVKVGQVITRQVGSGVQSHAAQAPDKMQKIRTNTVNFMVILSLYCSFANNCNYE